MTKDAVAVVSGVTITPRRSEIGTLKGNTLLILFLPIEGNDVFDGPEVRYRLLLSGSILDGVEVEVVFTSSCHRRA